MIRDKDYLKLFDNSSEDELSKEELEQIIEEELKKSEQDIDADLIEFCLDTLQDLERKERSIETEQMIPIAGFGKKRNRFKWLFIAAAAVLMFSALTLPATAVKVAPPIIAETADGTIQRNHEIKIFGEYDINNLQERFDTGRER